MQCEPYTHLPDLLSFLFVGLGVSVGVVSVVRGSDVVGAVRGSDVFRISVDELGDTREQRSADPAGEEADGRKLFQHS